MNPQECRLGSKKWKDVKSEKVQHPLEPQIYGGKIQDVEPHKW